MSYDTGDSLKTIDKDGKVPDCRMQDAMSCQSWINRLIDNDERRSWKRSRVDGLVDGNPPYRASKLRNAGRADACNVNWGTGRSYLEAGSGSFYDLSSEAPSAITFKTALGNDDQRNLWSNIASGEADKIFKADPTWDYQMQISQWDMVLHGCGPMYFESEDQVFPRAVRCGDLKVPEQTLSESTYWDGCFIQEDYFPPLIYEFIENEQAATERGWNVKYCKEVISNAMNILTQQGAKYSWEFYQQQCKTNSLTYYDDSKLVRVAHVFWKEFDGRITHAIVEVTTNQNSKCEYMFFRRGRYDNWQEALHPMYFDHGNGGMHYSVTGLGVKMYSAMEYENRLICNLCDKAFSPKILFAPTTSEAQQKFSMVRLGDYAVLPQGFQVQQGAVNGLMGDGLEMRQVLSGIMGNVLASYKQGVMTQKSGNPVTKFEKQMEAAIQSSLSMPQYNRYYKQLDMLYAEIWRRLSMADSTDERAKEFQKACKDKGVPLEALRKVDYVGATRVVGQGSAFMRKQAVDSIGQIVGSLPEDGRQNWIDDKISAEAGQAAVLRYNPKKAQKTGMQDEQQADAMLWVSAFKNSTPFVPTSEQNPVTYAATFINAASQSLNSLQQGGDPHQVLAFLNTCGPAIALCLSRFGQDATRQSVHDEMLKQWKQIASATDKLSKAMQAQAKQQQEQQKKTQDVLSDIQLKNVQTKAAIQDKQIKIRAQLQQSQEKHRLKMAQGVQSLQLKDATTATDIKLSRLKATSTKAKGSE